MCNTIYVNISILYSCSMNIMCVNLTGCVQLTGLPGSSVWNSTIPIRSGAHNDFFLHHYALLVRYHGTDSVVPTNKEFIILR